jgi:hypothetical protein
MLFSNLATELLENIFTYFEQDQKHNLASLSRVCRRFHSLIEPILYSSLEETGKHSLFNYLRTLLEIPHLGSYVKRYKGCQPIVYKPIFRQMGHPDMVMRLSHGEDTIPLPSGMSKAARQAVDYITFSAEESDGDKWHGDILKGSWHAITALVLAQLPNLQELHLLVIGNREWPLGSTHQIVAPYHWLKRPLMRAAQLQEQHISSPLSLEHLTTLIITQNSGKDRANPQIAQLWQLLGLQSLKRFVIQGWFFRYWNCRPKIQLPTVDLEFINCTFEFDFLLEGEDAFFDWFPDLEKFRFQHTDNRHHFHPQMITMLMQSLIRLQQPLRELYFEDTNDWDSVRQQDEGYFMLPTDDVELESFSSFGNLEVLETTAFDQWTRFNENNALPLAPFGEMLPSSIKLLTLRHASYATIPYVRGLLENRFAVPELHTLRLLYNSQDVNLGDLGGELAALQEEGQKCGVDIIVEHIAL